MLVSSVERIRALVPDNPDVSFERQRVAPQASEMIDWITENVPEGEHVLVTPAYSLNRYLVFLDAGRHEWTFMRLDQEPCDPEPNVEIRCDLDENGVSRISPDAVWVQVVYECKAVSLSMSNLLEQVRRTGSGYVMISGTYTLPGILKLPPHLRENGAFEVVHSELDHERTSGLNHSLVLLKSTGRTPRAVPTQMTANTELRLRRCEQAKGPA